MVAKNHSTSPNGFRCERARENASEYSFFYLDFKFRLFAIENRIMLSFFLYNSCRKYNFKIVIFENNYYIGRFNFIFESNRFFLKGSVFVCLFYFCYTYENIQKSCEACVNMTK